jgi:hypothetical protein
VLLTKTQDHPKCAAQLQNSSPLAMWFAEISQSISKKLAVKTEGK